MWPWGHLAVAYLLYTALARYRTGRRPRALPAIALAVGSQFPDLVDKPLAWTFGVLPGGRTLAHSLFFLALLLPVVYALGLRLGRLAAATAFVVGHVSHLLADIPPSVLAGDLTVTAYFFWPVLAAPEETAVDGILDAFLTYYELGAYEWAQFALLAVGAVVWYRDGAPGLEYVPILGRYAPVLDRG